MKITLFFLLLFIISSQAIAQGVWQVTTLANMPEPVSNNAMATDGSFVFSFMGVDSSKLYSGIHLKGFRYNIGSNTWDTIPPVPDNLTRIAGSASEVNGKIYIIGGYHVYSNGSEVSSENVFIYDPNTNSYTSGAPIPKATDDHVQSVWQDSLIYVISGWSNSGNILDVQIYDPALDIWAIGTALPAGSDYEAFGAAGVIIDNTIYYAGGVNDSWVFSMLPKMRTGTIDPVNPMNISWSTADDSLAGLYRSGAAVLEGKPLWLGGADKAYNFDAIEYGTGAGVEPLNRVTRYDPATTSFAIELGSITPIMDMRGIAQIDLNKYIIAGGIGPSQQVSNKTYLLEFLIPPGFPEVHPTSVHLSVFPNPASTLLEIRLSEKSEIRNWSITDIAGKIVSSGTEMDENFIHVSHLANGLYGVQVTTADEVFSSSFIVNK